MSTVPYLIQFGGTVVAMLVLMAHAYRVGYADGARHSRKPPAH